MCVCRLASHNEEVGKLLVQQYFRTVATLKIGIAQNVILFIIVLRKVMNKLCGIRAL